MGSKTIMLRGIQFPAISLPMAIYFVFRVLINGILPGKKSRWCDVPEKREGKCRGKVFREDSSYTLSDFLNAGERIPTEGKVSAYLRYSENSGKSFQSVTRDLYCALRDGLPSASEAVRYLSSGDFYLDHDSRFHFREGANRRNRRKESSLEYMRRQ